MKKRLAVVLVACATVVTTAISDDFYRLYWGGDDTACAYPTGTSAITDWSVTGEASAHLTVDDAQPVDECGLSPGDSDSDTTYISCPPTTGTCTVTFDLVDSAIPSGATILRVSPWVTHRKGTESGKTSPSTKLYFVIAATPYLACTKTITTTTYSLDYTTCWADINPATSLAWTSSDIDNLQLRLTQENASNSQTLYVTGAGVGVAWSYDP